MLESSCMIFINLQRIEKINELKSGYQPCPVEFDATKHLEKINQINSNTDVKLDLSLHPISTSVRVPPF